MAALLPAFACAADEDVFAYEFCGGRYVLIAAGRQARGLEALFIGRQSAAPVAP